MREKGWKGVWKGRRTFSDSRGPRESLQYVGRVETGVGEGPSEAIEGDREKHRGL